MISQNKNPIWGGPRSLWFAVMMVRGSTFHTSSQFSIFLHKNRQMDSTEISQTITHHSIISCHYPVPGVYLGCHASLGIVCHGEDSPPRAMSQANQVEHEKNTWRIGHHGVVRFAAANIHLSLAHRRRFFLWKSSTIDRFPTPSTSTRIAHVTARLRHFIWIAPPSSSLT